MQFSKIQFISLLLFLIVVPILVINLVWLSNSISTTGTMCFMGKSQDGQLVRTYPVIKFSQKGKDIFFNGKSDVELNRGQAIPILYQKDDPADARINSFNGVWIDTIIYAAIPFVILLMIFFHREVIPWGSIVEVGKRPFLRIIRTKT